MKKNDIDIIKNLVKEDETPISETKPSEKLTTEEQAYYYNKGSQDAYDKNYTNISNIEGRIYYEKGYKNKKEMLVDLFEEEPEEDEIMQRQKIITEQLNENKSKKHQEWQGTEKFENYVRKLAGDEESVMKVWMKV